MRKKVNKREGKRINLQIDGFAITHVGKVRSNNEDNYCLFGARCQDVERKVQSIGRVAQPYQEIVAVYDGLGGEEAGEIASSIAASSITACKLEQFREEPNHQIQAVNDKICNIMKSKGGGRMGTTMVALYIDRNKAVCCNVGDSRCYLLRKNVLQQLSVDHSEGQQMIKMGILTEEMVRQSKHKHKLTQHLGIFRDEFVIEPYFSPLIALQQGDSFLLCSDGLTDMVADNEIEETMKKFSSAEDVANTLVKKALLYGGKDNITVVVLQVKNAKRFLKRQKISVRWKIFYGICCIILLLLALIVITSLMR